MMGLDITAYRKLQVVENPEFDEYGELENWKTEWQPGESMEWSEKHFPGRGEGIDSKKVYTFAEEFRFRAGSYSGYNWWRNKLDKFIGNKALVHNKAFQELINFADNEGVIGFVVAKKLAKDFEDYENRASEYAQTLGENGEYWFESYLN